MSLFQTQISFILKSDYLRLKPNQMPLSETLQNFTKLYSYSCSTDGSDI